MSNSNKATSHTIVYVYVLIKHTKNTTLKSTKNIKTFSASMLNTTHSAHNLGFIFDEHVTFSNHILSANSVASSDVAIGCAVSPPAFRGPQPSGP